jgi:hypothetical protein
MRFTVIGIALALILPATAGAQTAPPLKTITATFSGVVTNDPGATIRIQQLGAVSGPGEPLKTFPYTGPLPDYPLKTGDKIQLSFDIAVPTKDYISSPDYKGQTAVDGIYQFAIRQSGARDANGNLLPTGTYAISNGGQASAPFTQSSSLSPVGLGGVTIIYDANTDAYNLKMGTGSFGWGSAGWDGPTYTYDYATNQAGLTNSTCGPFYDCSTLQPGGIPGRYGFQGDATSGYSTGSVQAVTQDIAPTVGFFDIFFSGSWNLPIFGGSGGSSSGGATDVPEPGMMTLFGLGAMALARRRKRARV